MKFEPVNATREPQKRASLNVTLALDIGIKIFKTNLILPLLAESSSSGWASWRARWRPPRGA
eukprot:47975-Chlamydomonas_euryale.AAC.1